MDKKYEILKSIAMPLEFYGEFDLYIDPDSYEIHNCSCGRCKKEYYDIVFSGYVLIKKERITFEYGYFKGYDNQCICDNGPAKAVLCYIDSSRQKVDWDFLRYYVQDKKVVNKLIDVLTKN